MKDQIKPPSQGVAESETPRMDARYLAIKKRLEVLTMIELTRLIDDMDTYVLYDTYNYDCNKMCPIAIALNLHRTLEGATDDSTRQAIEADTRFRPANILHGLKGEFYHGSNQERKWDLEFVCQKVLEEKARTLERDCKNLQQELTAAKAEIESLKEQLRLASKYKEGSY